MWNELKQLYIKDHLSKPLKAPGIRLNALARIEQLIHSSMPELIANPLFLNKMDKQILKAKLEKEKGYALNSAESSVINGLYNFLPYLNKDKGVQEITPEAFSKSIKKPDFKPKKISSDGDKLKTYQQIAEVVIDIIKEKGYPNGNYELSRRLDWMPIAPQKTNFPKYWKYLTEAYRGINGHRLELDKVLALHKNSLSTKLQEADIYFFEPFELIVEYDEEQHFNQFRLATLKSDFYRDYRGFDMQLYRELNDRMVKPGSRKSRFNFLKSADPLFPENHQEDKQDNRHRQRAFRDMMKDIAAAERNIKPLVRIPTVISGWKRKGLDKNDLRLIRQYLESLPVFSSL